MTLGIKRARKASLGVKNAHQAARNGVKVANDIQETAGQVGSVAGVAKGVSLAAGQAGTVAREVSKIGRVFGL